MSYHERKLARAETEAMLLGKTGLIVVLVAALASCSIRIEHTPECAPETSLTIIERTHP